MKRNWLQPKLWRARADSGQHRQFDSALKYCLQLALFLKIR
jgi:hypothetical protein